MSKTNDGEGDSRVDGRVHDGFRYLVKFRDGTREHCRDHDDLASVNARLLEALGDSATAQLHFSGARAVEGQMVYDDEDKPPTDVIGEVRGKGSFFASDIRGLTYTRFDEDRLQEAAYEAAAALLESQNRAQEEALGKIQEIQRKLLEGAGTAADQDQGEPGANLMG